MVSHCISHRMVHIVCIALMAILLSFQCVSSPTDDATTDVPTTASFPHTRPPEATMLPDFSSFGSGVSKIAAPQGSIHRGVSAITVGIWNVLVVAGLAIPVSVYVGALQEEPALTDSGYVWTFTHTVDRKTYTANLLGTIIDQKAVWKMRVSGPELNDNFLWYQGSSNFTATDGDWVFYQLNSTDSLLQINWSRNEPGTEASLSFVSKVDSTKGNSLEYGMNGTGRTFVAKDLVKGNTVTITWDAVTQAGSIQGTNYNNGNKGCWEKQGAQFKDVTCGS